MIKVFFVFSESVNQILVLIWKERESVMEEIKRNNELREAEEAGERALKSLYAVREKLNSTKKWVILDLLGGKMISTFVKQSRINEVEVLIEQARIRLTDFQKALRKETISAELQMEVSSFLTFADFAFDNPITDYLVQNRLDNIREEVDDTIQMTEELLDHIRNR